MQIDLSFIPDAISWDWEIRTFEVPENDISQMIERFKSWRYVPGWKYKMLRRKNVTVMSNTPDEICDFLHFTRSAKWNILINWLWLWCVIKELLGKEDVKNITVIEKSVDVINLVSPYFNDKRLNIINADAFEYNPPKWEKYDYVWHDIWDYISADNLPEMEKLHRKYWKRTWWQDSWVKEECKRLKRIESTRFYF